MIRYLFLGLVLAFSSCKKVPSELEGGIDFPTEFQGDWMFAEEVATAAIEEMAIDEEAKLKLQSSFVGMVRGESRHLDSSGRVTGASYPEELVIRYHFLEKRDDGFIAKTSNSMNPDAKQFTSNMISGGVWRSRLLDDSLEPVKGIPDDYWKRPEK